MIELVVKLEPVLMHCEEPSIFMKEHFRPLTGVFFVDVPWTGSGNFR